MSRRTRRHHSRANKNMITIFIFSNSNRTPATDNPAACPPPLLLHFVEMACPDTHPSPVSFIHTTANFLSFATDHCHWININLPCFILKTSIMTADLFVYCQTFNDFSATMAAQPKNEIVIRPPTTAVAALAIIQAQC